MVLLVLTAGSFLTAAEETAAFAQAVDQVAVNYATQIKEATEQLNATRARIARERIPLASHIQELESQVARLERALSDEDADLPGFANEKRELAQSTELERRNLAFMETLVTDALKSVEGATQPGESVNETTASAEIQRRPGQAKPEERAENVAKAFDLLVRRVEGNIGGRRVSGQAVAAGDSRVLEGTFMLLGPYAYFQSTDRQLLGLARKSPDSAIPLIYRLPGWTAAQADPLFGGKQGMYPADASDGKALQLKTTTGTFWSHIERGGYVAYAILLLGLVSLGLIVAKCLDLARLRVDRLEKFNAFVKTLEKRDIDRAREVARGLASVTKQLAETTLQAINDSQANLDARLESWFVHQRQIAERRLALLAVIATASPLTGLLGTVMGMTKTFALITVFGTGNAGKLSTGISEVLVTTELGLAVAIPTLVAHGILAHRIQKRLGLLEECVFEVSTAAKTPEEDLVA